MALLSADLEKLLARTRLDVLPEDYFVIHLPLDTKPIPGEWYRPATTRFAVFLRDALEINLIVARRKWLRMHSIFDEYKVSGPFKVIGFDNHLSMNCCGYMAVIGAVLAEADIKVVPISSFSRDHILVEKEDLPRTVRLLRHFMAGCKVKTARPVKKAPAGRRSSSKERRSPDAGRTTRDD